MLLIAFKDEDHTFAVGEIFPVHQPLAAFLTRAGNFNLNLHIISPGPLNGKRYRFEPLRRTGDKVYVYCEENKKEE
jgi:hypothetical protein